VLVCEPFLLNPQPVVACPDVWAGRIIPTGPPGSRIEAPDCPKELILSDSVLARLVVMVIVLISFALWLRSERNQSPACRPNCSTDFSAVRR
jgi:hypothetical protein